MNRIIPFISGLLFTTGLVVSGMTQPSKIVGFLDFFGAWDPSLMMVTLGAVAVYMPAYRWVMRLQRPLFSPAFSLPTLQDIEPRLVIGAALFGVGWGLAGYCPGPGVASLASGNAAPLVFMVTLLAGMIAFAVFDRATRVSVR